VHTQLVLDYLLCQGYSSTLSALTTALSTNQAPLAPQRPAFATGSTAASTASSSFAANGTVADTTAGGSSNSSSSSAVHDSVQVYEQLVPDASSSSSAAWDVWHRQQSAHLQLQQQQQQQQQQDADAMELDDSGGALGSSGRSVGAIAAAYRSRIITLDSDEVSATASLVLHAHTRH
jgi:hypothetical protein